MELNVSCGIIENQLSSANSSPELFSKRITDSDLTLRKVSDDVSHTNWPDELLREAKLSSFKIFPQEECLRAVETIACWEAAILERSRRLDEENANYGAELHEVIFYR